MRLIYNQRSLYKIRIKKHIETEVLLKKNENGDGKMVYRMQFIVTYRPNSIGHRRLYRISASIYNKIKANYSCEVIYDDGWMTVEKVNH